PPGLAGPAQRRQPANLVPRRVLAQRRADDVVVALRERGGEQRVGDGDQCDGADREDRGVPHREAQPQRVAQRAHARGLTSAPSRGLSTEPTPRTVCSSFSANGLSIRSRRRDTSTSTTFVFGSKL